MRALLPELPPRSSVGRIAGAGRLGRHVNHDEASRAYPVRALLGPTRARRAVLHRRHVAIYDQGNLGSCTGQALAGCLSTGPFRHRYSTQRYPRMFYRHATELDPWPGSWPPEDTGSDGLSVCKVAVAHGIIRGYTWGFSLTDLLDTLQAQPLIVGTAWKGGMDAPDSSGLVHAVGDDRGGHEYCAVGDDPERRRVRFANSWTAGWGDGGYFDLAYDDLASLLADNGDVTVPVLH